MARILVGDAAPDICLPTQTGEEASLSQFRGRVVVLYFYPKDETTVCTKEARAFRDAYEDFVQAGAVVIGASGDSVESHEAFAAHHRLPFLLFCDASGKLRKAFGVPKTLGVLPGRVTYVIDKQGIVRHVFTSQLDAEEHVRQARDVVRRLAEG